MEQDLYNALVVDDNPISLRVIENLIRGYQVNVTTAAGGPEALEKIVSMEYDIVFMDHMMPGMDGIETLHAIRALEGDYYKKVPVVALTANEAEGAREFFLSEGFQDFLQKPMKPAQLKVILEKFLFRVQAAEEETLSATEETKESVTEAWEEILIAEGLDVKTALLYCNGKASYLDILQEYCRMSDEMEKSLEEAYTECNWERYVISIHGMKGALRSIGANELSDAAKLLERAGRERSVPYIAENHGQFLLQYKNLFAKLKINPLLCTKKLKEDSSEDVNGLQPETSVRELGEEEFRKLIEAMEEAAYMLEVERFVSFAEELIGCRYRGAALRELSELLHRKIQKADYLSAVSAIKQWKQRL